MALKANAETAHDIAAALLKFKDPLPESATEITSTVGELFQLQSSLLELDLALHDRRNSYRAEDVEEDKRVVLLSLQYTFGDINRRFAGLDQPQHRSDREAYQSVWHEIQTHFYSESQNSLAKRFLYYKKFLSDLSQIVTGVLRPDEQFDELFDRFDRLLQVQEDSLAEDLENLQLGTPRQRSWERRRPGLPQGALATSGRRTTGIRPGPARPGFVSPISPTGFNEYPFFTPVAPEVPIPSSPTTTTTTTASTTSSSGPPIMSDHWLPVVFGQNRPTTHFTRTGTESICHGQHQPGASQKLKADHVEQVMMGFESGDLEVRLYVRERDRRARIWCRVDRAGRKSQFVQSITTLRIQRKDSCLMLCKPDSRGRVLNLWCNLRFASYERMVLFFCSFLALKAQDETENPSRLDDHILDDEIPVFSGKIIDDSYEHALQIFRDVNSGGIRLLASGVKGHFKRCPIWTAFINYKIMAKAWNKRVEAKKVHILDMTRYIFSHKYRPQLGPSGEHELHFIDAKDAGLFCKAIDDLAEGKYGKME